MSRILRSSASSFPNSFFSAYHLERQSLLTAIRSPIGLVFCPIINSGQRSGLSPLRLFDQELWSWRVLAGETPARFHPLSDKTILTWQLRFNIGPAEPRALGVIRRRVVAVCATASLTRNTSGFRPLLFSALAMADFKVLATNRADLRDTKASTAWAWSAFMPWICRTTSRIFCADMRTLRVMA